MKKTIIYTLLFFCCLSVGYAQKKEIKFEDDYRILNKTLARYFFFKHKNDSLELAKLLFLKEKSPNDKVILRALRKAGKEKNNDTLYIKAIADKDLYHKFLSKNAKWRKEKKRYKKISNRLNNVFSEEEIANYNKQLGDNFYVWKAEKIGFKNRVFIKKLFKYTKSEIKSLKKEGKVKEIEKLSDFNKSINYKIFTFSKPIYSKKNAVALIAYQYLGNYILYVFKKTNNEWTVDFVLSDSYFINSI